MLAQQRRDLDSLVSGLLEHETLDEADAYAAAGLPRRLERAPEPQLTTNVMQSAPEPDGHLT